MFRLETSNYEKPWEVNNMCKEKLCVVDVTYELSMLAETIYETAPHVLGVLGWMSLWIPALRLLKRGF